MKHYYITDPSAENGFVELTESEFLTIIGTEETRLYATRVYRSELSIEEVPEDLRETVQTIIDAKIARWGEYKNQKITSNELQTMIEEVL